MYVNRNLTRQYAFIRKYKNEVLFIVSNFSDEDVSVCVNVPEHAFGFLGIPEKMFHATEMLTERERVLDFSANRNITDAIRAYGVNIYKFVI